MNNKGAVFLLWFFLASSSTDALFGDYGLYGAGTGLTNHLYGASGSGIVNHKVPFATPTEEEELKLIGRNVFRYSTDHYDAVNLHGVAVTIEKNKIHPASSFGLPHFGNLFGHQGGVHEESLSLTLEAQSSRPGRYYVVFTNIARVRDGCSEDTLGDVLTPPHQGLGLFSPFHQFGLSQSELPDGVVADVTLGRNIKRSIEIRRLKQFKHLESLAGKGVALCAADDDDDNASRSYSRRSDVCKGVIVACTGLSYSNENIDLGILRAHDRPRRPRPNGPPRGSIPPHSRPPVGPPYPPGPVPPPGYQGPPPPPRPSGPLVGPPYQSGPPPNFPPQQDVYHPDGPPPPGLREEDLYGNGGPSTERSYYDLDTDPYYDTEKERLDTYSPPPRRDSASIYDQARRLPDEERDYGGPYGYDDNGEEYPPGYQSQPRTDREFGFGPNQNY